MSTIATLIVKLAAETVLFVDHMNHATHVVDHFAADVAHADNNLAHLGHTAIDVAKDLAGVATVAGGMGLGVKLAADWEQSENVLAGMLHSAEKAHQMMDDLSNIQGFDNDDLQHAATSLVSAHIAGERVIPTLRMLGDVAAGSGNEIDELAAFYHKAAVMGRVYGGELTQLGQNGVPIIEALSQELGVSTEEMSKMVEEGKVSFPQLENAFIRLTEEGGLFHNAVANQMAGFWGSVQQLEGGIESVLRAFGAGFLDAAGLEDPLNAIANALNNIVPLAELTGTVIGTMVGFVIDIVTYFDDWAVTLGVLYVAFQGLIFAVGTYIQLMLALKIAQIAWMAVAAVANWMGIVRAIGLVITALTLQHAWTWKLVYAQIALLLTSPHGWAMLAAGVLVGTASIYGAVKAYESLGAATEKITPEKLGRNAIQEVDDWMERYKKRIEEATSAAKEIHERNMTPGEKHDAGVDKVLELQGMVGENAQSLISQVDATREMARLKKEMFEADPANKAMRKLDEENAVLSAQVRTWSEAKFAADEYKLAREGVNETVIEEIRLMHEANEALRTRRQEQKDIDEAVKKAQTANQSPFEKYEAEMAKLKGIKDKLDPAVYLRNSEAFKRNLLSDMGLDDLSPLDKFEQKMRSLESVRNIIGETRFALESKAAVDELDKATKPKTEAPKLRERGSAAAYEFMASRNDPARDLVKIQTDAKALQAQVLDTAKEIVTQLEKSGTIKRKSL